MGSRGSAWTAAACRRWVCVPHPAPGLPSNRPAWRTNGLLTDPRPAVTTAFNTGPPSAGSQSPVRMRLIAAATSDLTEPVRLWLAGRLATAPASWRTPNASRPRRRRAQTEGCAPPRPLARVEPGPPWNRYHRAGVEPGPPKAWRGGRIRPKPPVPSKGGTASKPSCAAGFSQGAAWVAVWAAMGARGRNECPRVPKNPVVCGRRQWRGRSPGAVRWSDSASKLAHSKRFATSEALGGHGGTRSTASLGPGRTGPSMESLPSGWGGTRASNGQCRRVSSPSGWCWLIVS